MENGEAYQWKDGLGIINRIPVKILSVGEYKIIQKVVGKAGLSARLFGGNQGTVYTGFDPSKARWISQTNSYLLVVDYDQDVQLDIAKVFEDHAKPVPDDYSIKKKLMAGSMWVARERARDKQKKGWWKENGPYVLIFVAFLSLIITGYFITHVNANFDVTLKGQPVNALLQNTTSGTNFGTGVGGSVYNASVGAYNAITHVP